MDGEDFRMPVHPRRGGMNVQIAKPAAKRLLLVERNVLIAEKDHQMLHPGVVDFLECLLAEGLGQIDAVNLRPNGELSAGPHAVDWNGRDDAGQRVASGIYFYRLRSETTVLTRRMVLLK